jgi:hypothetical protein
MNKDMLKIKVVNCDGIVVGYEWNSITDFIAAVNSDSEVILMLDDELSDVVTDNNRLNNWWKHHNRAVTVNKLYCKALDENERLTVRDIIANRNFDFNANVEIYICKENTTWDENEPVYRSGVKNAMEIETLYDHTVKYMTIHDHALIIEVGKED